MRRQKITGGKFFRPGLPRRSETKTGRGWIGLGVDTHGFTVGCFLPRRRRWGRPVLPPMRTAGKSSRRKSAHLRRLVFDLRRLSGNLRGRLPGWHDQNPLCAAKNRLARRFSALRGRPPVLRGQNPVCAPKNRFARAAGVPARKKSALREQISLCAAIFRFARTPAGFARTNFGLRAENPVCAGVFHFARAFCAKHTSFPTRRCIKRDSLADLAGRKYT